MQLYYLKFAVSLAPPHFVFGPAAKEQRILETESAARGAAEMDMAKSNQFQ